jgi:hypothetical protein
LGEDAVAPRRSVSEQGLAGGGGVRRFEVAEHRLGDGTVGVGVQDAHHVGVGRDPEGGHVPGAGRQCRDAGRSDAGEVVVGDGLAAERGQPSCEVVAAAVAGGRLCDVVLGL